MSCGTRWWRVGSAIVILAETNGHLVEPCERPFGDRVLHAVQLGGVLGHGCSPGQDTAAFTKVGSEDIEEGESR
jgi:hypothetical protein